MARTKVILAKFLAKFLAAFLALASTRALAQPPQPSFDVISIREAKPDPPISVGSDNPAHNSKFSATNYTAMILIQIAYSVTYLQVTGAPSWVTSARFNIQAKADPALDDRLSKLSDDDAKALKQQMLRSMLEDRFHLKLHPATKKLDAYALVLQKGGPKLHEHPIPGQDRTTPAIEERVSASGTEFTAHAASMQLLAAHLTGQLGATVLDRTGLTAQYDFTLQVGKSTQDADSEWPSLYTALPEQLGLRLESIKGPVPDLVIDHIEMPTPN